MDKAKGLPRDVLTMVFGAASSHPFVAGDAIGMLIMYALMLAYDRNPTMFEDMRIVCETACLVVIGGK